MSKRTVPSVTTISKKEYTERLEKARQTGFVERQTMPGECPKCEFKGGKVTGMEGEYDLPMGFAIDPVPEDLWLQGQTYKRKRCPRCGYAEMIDPPEVEK